MPESPNGVALIGLPFDAASSFASGAAEAPRAIRRALASRAGNLWTESGVDLSAVGLEDLGDVERGPDSGTDDRIAIAVARALDAGLRPLCLGGDHWVTYPVVRAVAARFRGLEILQFDAHPDLYDRFDGSRVSHACPFARIMEAGLAGRLLQLGVRASEGHQREQALRFGVETITMRDWEAGTRPRLGGPLYVSVDLDVLDPAFAPGVAHREPGGLSVREVIGVIQRLESPPVGADVVELNPRRDPTGATSAVAAKIVKELAARMVERR